MARRISLPATTRDATDAERKPRRTAARRVDASAASRLKRTTPAFATTPFFLILVMTLLDVLAGVVVTIISARRDVEFAGQR